MPPQHVDVSEPPAERRGIASTTNAETSPLLTVLSPLQLKRHGNNGDGLTSLQGVPPQRAALDGTPGRQHAAAAVFVPGSPRAQPLRFATLVSVSLLALLVVVISTRTAFPATPLGAEGEGGGVEAVDVALFATMPAIHLITIASPLDDARFYDSIQGAVAAGFPEDLARSKIIREYGVNPSEWPKDLVGPRGAVAQAKAARVQAEPGSITFAFNAWC